MKTAGDANCFIQEKPTIKENKNKVSEHQKKKKKENLSAFLHHTS